MKIEAAKATAAKLSTVEVETPKEKKTQKLILQ